MNETYQVTASEVMRLNYDAGRDEERERMLAIIEHWVGVDGLNEPWWPNMMAELRGETVQ